MRDLALLLLHPATLARLAVQQIENQLVELRRYVGARGWGLTENVDQGVSGAKDRRRLSVRARLTVDF